MLVIHILMHIKMNTRLLKKMVHVPPIEVGEPIEVGLATDLCKFLVRGFAAFMSETANVSWKDPNLRLLECSRNQYFSKSTFCPKPRVVMSILFISLRCTKFLG